MPVYKMPGSKDGKQKYRVRINYTDKAVSNISLTELPTEH